MKFEVVTTCNADGYKKYGRRMLASFNENWPDRVSLRCYYEGWRGIHTSRIRYLDLLAESPWLQSFKDRHGDEPVKGMPWDAVRFAHKVAAVTHAAVRSNADVLIWLDADTVTHSSITIRDLERLAPRGDRWIAWLDRKNQYPECGFYMLNLKHPKHFNYIRAFESQYRADKLFKMKQWHDSWVLWKTVEAEGAPAVSLSGPGFATAHPFINGPLGQWFDHMKGNRKEAGRSRQADLVNPRQEAYWNE